MTTRARFRCSSIKEWDTTYEYRLDLSYTAPENQAWSKGFSGNMNLTVLKSSGKLFEVGKEYQIDITNRE